MELDVEEACRDEPVEMERGKRPADANGGRGGVPIDGLGLVGDMGIERPADRVREWREPIDRLVGHRRHSIARFD